MNNALHWNCWKMERNRMEQLKVVTQQDNERMFRMISDLISKDKEFQIMITVPSGRQYEQNQAGEEKRIAKEYNLEKDVTDMRCLIPLPRYCIHLLPRNIRQRQAEWREPSDMP